MIKDANGREWVLVPKDGDWNMTKAALALITSSNINTGDLKIGTLAAAFENAIAAAPQFVPPAVTDETAQLVAEKIAELRNRLSVAIDALATVEESRGEELALAVEENGRFREALTEIARSVQLGAGMTYVVHGHSACKIARKALGGVE